MDRLRNDRNVKNSDRRTNMRGKHKCRESKTSEIVFEENETEKESNRRERKEKT